MGRPSYVQADLHRTLTNTLYKWTSLILQADGHTIKCTPLTIYDDTDTAYHLDTYAQAAWHSGALKHRAIAGIDYRHGNLATWYGSGGSMPDLDLTNPNYSHSWIKPETALTIKGKTIQTGVYVQDQITKCLDRAGRTGLSCYKRAFSLYQLFRIL